MGAAKIQPPLAEEKPKENYAEAFRKSLEPFGLDKFMISDAPDRILTLENGRVLAEFRTMPLPIWYPEKLNELAAAGFDVVTYKKRYQTRAPQMMYYVRLVQEIRRENHGNQ